MDLSELRRNYALQSLSEQDVLPDPFQQFAKWFGEAQKSEILEPNAMTLATSNSDGQPSARVVLLKEMRHDGFVFFTNYQSQKAHDLTENPKAALLFAWLPLERQIRIEGLVERVSAQESEAYFQSRPKGSQIGAWASPQSTVIPDRDFLEKRVDAIAAEYKAAEKLPLPDFWGGYVLRPLSFEFWQGRESRLHDRIRYELLGEQWQKKRLAP